MRDEIKPVTLNLTLAQAKLIIERCGDKLSKRDVARLRASVDPSSPASHRTRHLCGGVTAKGSQCQSGARYNFDGAWWCAVHRRQGHKSAGL